MNKIRVRKYGNKGITLIALVITIIVLLILAGVSIAMLTGENGVLTKASQAKETTNKEGAREKLNLILNGLQTDKIPKGEKLELGDELASEIGAFDEVTSATYTGRVIEVVIDGYTFEVNGDLGIDDKKEIAKVEPENVDDWEWNVEDDGSVTLLKYNGDDTVLVIPNYIDGHWVKTIGDGSNAIWNLDKCEEISAGTTGIFYYQNDIVEIVISEGIEEISLDCFYNTTNLEKVSIPYTVKKIGIASFKIYALPGKKRENFVLNIPSTVEIVGKYIVGKYDTINVEFESNEIPDTWDSEWNCFEYNEMVNNVNYGVEM